jgi:hypothetical protein
MSHGRAILRELRGYGGNLHMAEAKSGADFAQK